MSSFKTYEEARAQARTEARKHKVSYGIEKFDRSFEPWHIFMLPKPDNRYGFELRCEVVNPDDPIGLTS